MVTKHLSRPDNVLINRLGFSTNWSVPATRTFSLKRSLMLFKFYFFRFFLTLWRSGSMFANHFFAGCFFLGESLTTLPRFYRAEEASRFFRLVRIRYSVRFKNKRFFMARKFLVFLNIGELFFYRLSGFVFILAFCHIPEPIKRKNFLIDYLGQGSASLTTRADRLLRSNSRVLEPTLFPILHKIYFLL